MLKTIVTPIIILLCVICISTLYVGYQINTATLRAALIDREKKRSEQIVHGVKALLAAEVENLSNLSNLAARDDSLADVLVEYAEGWGGPERIAEVSEELKRHMGVDVMEVTDSRGAILYSGDSDRRPGALSDIWGVDEALDGEKMVVAVRLERGWGVRCLAPLAREEKILGTLNIGFDVNNEFVRKISRAVHSEISIATLEGIVAGAIQSEGPMAVDFQDTKFWNRLAEAERPVFRENPRLKQFAMYAAVRVVDETFCLLVKTDISSTYELLELKNRQLLKRSFFILFISIIAGSAAAVFISRPLGKLKKKIMALAARYSEKNQPLIVEGNEIKQLVNAFEVMSEAVEDAMAARKRSEKTLKENEKKYRNLFSSALDGILIFSEKALLLDINDAGRRLFGLDKETILKTSPLEYLPEDIFNQLADFIRGERSDEELFLAFQWTRRDGALFELELQSKSYFQNHQRQFITNLKDVTERKRTEREKKELLEKAERFKKMEALGLLAGGVAHDLNNILSGILSYPDLLLLEDNLDESVRRSIETIKLSGEKAAAVVTDLLTIARGVAIEKTAVDLNTLIQGFRDSPEFLKIKMDCPFIHFVSDSRANLSMIRASETHLIKILLNLVINAAESFPEKDRSGVVRVGVRNVNLDAPLEGYEKFEEGEYVCLSVSDTGPGISKKHLPNIFEPFYTRKFMGRGGTGLELAVVWNLMEDHYGYIQVKSDHEGARFDLYFPAVRETRKSVVVLPPIEKYRGRGERILVVDDEELQRDLCLGILTRLGYRVDSVSSGESALSYIKNARVDLVILDMIMDPGINGLETFKRILDIRPDQKAIVISGFSESDDVRRTLTLGAGRFIKKPYTIEVLGMSVKSELNNPG